MKKILFLFLAALLFSQLTLKSSLADGKWTLKKSKSSVKVYVREVEGSALKQFRGETVLEDTSLSSLLALLDDAKNYPAWMYNCTKAKVLKKINQRERISYMVVNSPWPVSDRDSITYTKVYQDNKSLAVKVIMQGRPNFIAKNSEYVRIPKTDGYWLFTPLKGNKIKVVFQLHNDPGGSVPASLANSFVVDMPFYTLKNMHTTLKQKKYRDAKYPQIKEPNN